MAYRTPYNGLISRRNLSTIGSDIDRQLQSRLMDIQLRGPGGRVGGGGGITPEIDPSSFLDDFDPAAAIGGIAGLAGMYGSMVNQDLGLGNPDPLQLSATGQPIYDLGGFYNQAYQARPQGASAGELIGAGLQGASAGAAAGGPVGAAAGLAVGLGTAIFGGNRRKKKQEQEKRKALEKARKGQQSFNEASQRFETDQLVLEDYLNRQSMTDKLYNLYR